MSARCWRFRHGWGWDSGTVRRVDTALRRADRRARRNGRPRGRFDTPKVQLVLVPAWGQPFADVAGDLRRAWTASSRPPCKP